MGGKQTCMQGGHFWYNASHSGASGEMCRSDQWELMLKRKASRFAKEVLDGRTGHQSWVGE